MVISSVVNENGDPLDPSQTRGTILKESSPEFQVNPAPVQSIFSLTPKAYDAGNSAVAMDATGDFVITWSARAKSREA